MERSADKRRNDKETEMADMIQATVRLRMLFPPAPEIEDQLRVALMGVEDARINDDFFEKVTVFVGEVINDAVVPELAGVDIKIVDEDD